MRIRPKTLSWVLDIQKMGKTLSLSRSTQSSLVVDGHSSIKRELTYCMLMGVIILYTKGKIGFFFF